MTDQKHTPLTDDRIAEIRSRNAARTPGKWTDDPGDGSIGSIEPVGGGMQIAQAAQRRRITGPDPHRERLANASFIAHAPDDITDLLADNDRLRAAALPASVVEAMAQIAPGSDEWTCIEMAFGAVRAAESGDNDEDVLCDIDNAVALLLRASALLTAPGDGR